VKILDWMFWTWPTALFFAAVAVMFVVMSILQWLWPTIERKGFLPIPTTRGDRLFIGLLGSAWIHIGWLAVTMAPLWWASLVAVVWFIVVMRFG
jgi:predicted small integral membrane protein